MKRKYGLVGYPLGHSFSRSFFQQKFEDEHINATYENFEIQDISCLRQLISDNHELCGLNVTIPHKTAVIPLLDELHPLAREIGAVNVIKITRQGDKIFLKGFNSDIIGFTNSIAPLLDDRMTEALILGTGGASKAIHAGLKALHITPTFVSRQKRGDILSYEDLSPDLIDNHKIIVDVYKRQVAWSFFPNTSPIPANERVVYFFAKYIDIWRATTTSLLRVRSNNLDVSSP